MKQTILFDNNLKLTLLDVVEKTANIAKKTMGAKGSNVLLYDSRYGTRITKDGITVIRSLNYEDSTEKGILNLIRESCEKTNMIGDGTTGTCVLLDAICREGMKHIGFGTNGILLRSGIQKAVDYAVKAIEKRAVKISSRDEIYKVANIASNHNDEISTVLSDAFLKIGENGTIRIENGKSRSIESQHVEGMQFNSGYLSPYFITNDEMTTELENPYILILGKKLSNIQDILRILQDATDKKVQLLIIAESVDGDALSTLVLNRLRGNLISCAVSAPSYGENRDNMLDDIAIFTGGNVIAERTGISSQEVTSVNSPIIGRAKRVIVSKDTTTIIGGKGCPEQIAERISQLKTQINSPTVDEFSKRKIKERLAKLDGGIEIISVGGNTATEALEKRDLVDDAYSACKASIEGGVVQGGGIALVRAHYDLENAIKNGEFDNLSEDEMIGVKLLSKALLSTSTAILENAGENPFEVIKTLTDISNNFSDKDKSNYVYDIISGKYDDMFTLGVIDPTNVIVNELINASSTASSLLTTCASVATVPSPEDNNQNKQM